jgi:hypothetical protein
LVANINEDVRIPYSNKKILSKYEIFFFSAPFL